MTSLLVAEYTVLALGITSFAVYIATRPRRMAEKRSVAMRAAAEKLGFEYHEQAPEALVERLDGLRPFEYCRSMRFTNVMRGSSEFGETTVFDAQHLVAGGRHTQGMSMRSFACHFPQSVVFPAFRLTPLSAFRRAGRLLGEPGIDLELHPQFSRQYLLQGEDVEGIRARFTPPVIELLEVRPGLQVQADGNVLFVRLERSGARSAEIVEGVETARRLFALLVESYRRRAV